MRPPSDLPGEFAVTPAFELLEVAELFHQDPLSFLPRLEARPGWRTLLVEYKRVRARMDDARRARP